MADYKKENLILDCPIIPIVIFPDMEKIEQLKSAGTEYEGRKINALIDTGAQHSVIRQSIIDDMKPKFFKNVTLDTFEGSHPSKSYYMVITTESMNGIRLQLPIIASSLKNTALFDAVIGRDFLSGFEFKYYGTLNSYAMIFKI